MPMLTYTTTPLPGLCRIDRQPVADDRGYFSRLFCDEAMHPAIWDGPIKQINHTMTQRKAAVRGMHFQKPPSAEEKLVTCLVGEVFDVAVDLRHGSDTFLQWHGEILSADNMRSLLIPKGFAHGFQTLTNDCMLMYLHSAAYDSEREAGLNPCDSALMIDWPLPISQLSARDSSQPPITSDYKGIAL